MLKFRVTNSTKARRAAETQRKALEEKLQMEWAWKPMAAMMNDAQSDLVYWIPPLYSSNLLAAAAAATTPQSRRASAAAAAAASQSRRPSAVVVPQPRRSSLPRSYVSGVPTPPRRPSLTRTTLTRPYGGSSQRKRRLAQRRPKMSLGNITPTEINIVPPNAHVHCRACEHEAEASGQEDTDTDSGMHEAAAHELPGFPLQQHVHDPHHPPHYSSQPPHDHQTPHDPQQEPHMHPPPYSQDHLQHVQDHQQIPTGYPQEHQGTAAYPQEHQVPASYPHEHEGSASYPPEHQVPGSYPQDHQVPASYPQEHPVSGEYPPEQQVPGYQAEQAAASYPPDHVHPEGHHHHTPAQEHTSEHQDPLHQQILYHEHQLQQLQQQQYQQYYQHQYHQQYQQQQTQQQQQVQQQQQQQQQHQLLQQQQLHQQQLHQQQLQQHQQHMQHQHHAQHQHHQHPHHPMQHQVAQQQQQHARQFKHHPQCKQRHMQQHTISTISEEGTSGGGGSTTPSASHQAAIARQRPFRRSTIKRKYVHEPDIVRRHSEPVNKPKSAPTLLRLLEKVSQIHSVPFKSDSKNKNKSKSKTKNFFSRDVETRCYGSKKIKRPSVKVYNAPSRMSSRRSKSSQEDDPRLMYLDQQMAGSGIPGIPPIPGDMGGPGDVKGGPQAGASRQHRKSLSGDTFESRHAHLQMVLRLLSQLYQDKVGRQDTEIKLLKTRVQTQDKHLKKMANLLLQVRDDVIKLKGYHTSQQQQQQQQQMPRDPSQVTAKDVTTTTLLSIKVGDEGKTTIDV